MYESFSCSTFSLTFEAVCLFNCNSSSRCNLRMCLMWFTENILKGTPFLLEVCSTFFQNMLIDVKSQRLSVFQIFLFIQLDTMMHRSSYSKFVRNKQMAIGVILFTGYLQLSCFYLHYLILKFSVRNFYHTPLEATTFWYLSSLISLVLNLI